MGLVSLLNGVILMSVKDLEEKRNVISIPAYPNNKKNFRSRERILEASS